MRGGGTSGGADRDGKVNSNVTSRPGSLGQTVQPIGGSGGMLAGTTDSGIVSAGSWHFDLRVGTIHDRPTGRAFFARQHGATPSSAGSAS
jgi:hypothetical protein